MIGHLIRTTEQQQEQQLPHRWIDCGSPPPVLPLPPPSQLPRRQPSYHFERKTRLSPDRSRLELEMRQERGRRRDGSRSSRKRRRDYGRSWGPGQMRRKQVSTFRSEVWRWWRHSVFAPLALLVSGIRAIGCSFTSPRDRTVIWRVDVFLW